MTDVALTAQESIVLYGAYQIMTKSRRVWTPLCPDHADYWAVRAWFTYGGGFAVVGSQAGLVFVVATHAKPEPRWIAAALVALGVAFMAWLLAAAIIHGVGIRMVDFGGDGIVLTGVHANFAAALEQGRSQVLDPSPSMLDEHAARRAADADRDDPSR